MLQQQQQKQQQGQKEQVAAETTTLEKWQTKKFGDQLQRCHHGTSTSSKKDTKKEGSFKFQD